MSASGGVDRLDSAPGVERLAQHLGALDHEDAVRPGARCGAQEAPQPLHLLDAGTPERRAQRGLVGSPCLLGDLDQRGERGGVGDGEVGEDLAVDLDLGQPQPGDERL